MDRIAELVVVLEGFQPKSGNDVLDLVELLQRYTESELIAACDRVLQNDDPEMRIRAERILGNMGPKAKVAVPRIINAPGTRTKMEAFELALATWRICPDLMSGTGAIIKGLESPDWTDRQAAAWVLCMLREKPDLRAYIPSAIPQLIQLAAHDPVPHVRFSAVLVLGKLGHGMPDVTKTVKAALHDSEAAVRNAAALVLGSHSDSPQTTGGTS